MKKQALAAVLLLSASAIQAQNNTWQAPAGTSSLWEQFLDNLSDYDDIEAGSTEDMYEELRELEATPIDLNNATDDDIQRLVFLSNAQREELTEYLDRHRPIRSIGELAMIKSLDNVTLRLLNCFVYVGNIDESRKFPTWKEIAKHGKNELLGYVKVPFYERKGDREAYLGYKYKHWIRYKYSYGQLLQAGITGAQDAGEPFFGSHNKMGYDHYAFYILARKLGRIRTLALGQYKARFGLGLVMNAGFGMGKTTSMVLATPQNSITANASRSEASYLQGVASTIEIYKNITTTAFASYRKIDATLNDDSTIKTILKTGYHRTETEIKKRHNASQTTAGMNVNVKHNGISVGATAVYTAFSKDLKPDKSQAFRLYSPNGNNFRK
jgi:DNA uptake protein ComE-like DNA-binding protein